MKWFHHLTDRRTSKTLNTLWAEMGLEGEALFWRFLELVGGAFGPPDFSTSFELNLAVIRQHLPTTPRKLEKFLKILQEQNDITIERRGHGRGETILLDYPKISLMADEYSRKVRRLSGVNPDHGRTNSGQLSGQTPDNVLPEQNRTEQNRTSSPVPAVNTSPPSQGQGMVISGLEKKDSGNGHGRDPDHPVDTWGGLPTWFLDAMMATFPVRYNYITPPPYLIHSGHVMVKSHPKEKILTAFHKAAEGGAQSLAYVIKLLEDPAITRRKGNTPEEAAAAPRCHLVVNTVTQEVRQIQTLDEIKPDEEVL